MEIEMMAEIIMDTAAKAVSIRIAKLLTAQETEVLTKEAQAEACAQVFCDP